METQTESILNIAFYRFFRLSNLDGLRSQLKEIAGRHGLKGTIIISPEGVNGSMAGTPIAVESFWKELTTLSGFESLSRKDSYSETVPFKKLFIKKKKEIIPFGVPTVDATERLAPYLTPEQLKQWFLDGREFVLLDTRNTYEIEKGTFENAKHLNLQHFKNFPQALEKRSEEFKGKPVVMFCTGGIRCEKAAVYAKDLGLDAWQLEGGILNYFERVGSLGYKGDCFVFDERSALDPALKQSK